VVLPRRRAQAELAAASSPGPEEPGLKVGWGRRARPSPRASSQQLQALSGARGRRPALRAPTARGTGGGGGVIIVIIIIILPRSKASSRRLEAQRVGSPAGPDTPRQSMAPRRAARRGGGAVRREAPARPQSGGPKPRLAGRGEEGGLNRPWESGERISPRRWRTRGRSPGRQAERVSMQRLSVSAAL